MFCQPIVKGPLSELSSSIGVQGQVPGNFVTILSLPSLKKLAAGMATSGDQYFPLLPGIHLDRSDKVVALQALAADVSELPPIGYAMGVQPGPQQASDLGLLSSNTHLYEWGQFIWLTGALPGAMITVTSNGKTIGTGQALEGFLRLSLMEGLHPGAAIAAHQFAILPSGVLIAGPELIMVPDPAPVMDPGLLEPPVLQLPLRKCDLSMFISQVIDGARVTIRRSAGFPDESAGFDAAALWFALGHELKEGETVMVRQDLYARCELVGKWSLPESVGPLGVVEPPVVAGPLCRGMRRIVLQNLRPGARVSIFANETEYKGTAPLDTTVGTFGIPFLESDTVSATQTICGVASASSAGVPVEQHEESIPAVKILASLFACGRNVSVNNIHPGAMLQVFARQNNIEFPISPQVSVLSPVAVLDIFPLLQLKQEIFVAQWTCAQTRTDSEAVKVVQNTSFHLPKPVDACMDGDMAVQLWDVLPGAKCEFFISHDNGPFHYAGMVVGNALFKSLFINMPYPLKKNDQVRARQSLCDWTSDLGKPVTIHARPGYGPRPFYVVGHNPNDIGQVRSALDNGANAIEPDVNVYEHCRGDLCISHDEGDAGSPPLNKFLSELHLVASQDPRLSLVVFDCKSPVAAPEHGLTLLTAIRNQLTYDLGLSIIISVSSIEERGIFDHIRPLLGPREGLMIDEDNGPVGISIYFQSVGVVNHGYGNGISIPEMSITAPHARPSMERACALRAAANKLKFIYIWTVNAENLKREYIHIGVDGIISDDVRSLRDITAEPQFANVIRIANRLDNPFQPGNFGYSLGIHTADRGYAGTDANVTFTITGVNGVASVTVDTSLRFRMERDRLNFVTLQSPDLGSLMTMTVQRDNHGLAPDWFLDKIVVESARYGVTKTARFNRNINSTAPFIAPLL